jgi:hypothetical protein
MLTISGCPSGTLHFQLATSSTKKEKGKKKKKKEEKGKKYPPQTRPQDQANASDATPPVEKTWWLGLSLASSSC